MFIDDEIDPRGAADPDRVDAASPGEEPFATLPVEPWDAVDHVIEVAAMEAVFAAQRLVAVSQMHRDAVTRAHRDGLVDRGVIERSIRLELACALRITESSAGSLLARAEALTRRYPAVLEALGRARITERHADILVDVVDTAEAWLRDELAACALALAETMPIGTFRRAVRALVDAARAQTLVERQTEAVARRRTVLEPGDDGMAWYLIHLPAVEARAIHNRVTALAWVLVEADARVAANDDTANDDAATVRTLDQARADVVADLLIDGVVGAHPDATHGIRATVAVTVPVLSLLDSDAADAAPATVEGVGPITHERARELCGGATGWMRVLTHPETGVVLSVGRELYRPPPELRRLVRWRAGRCMAPGCGMPADRCEIDHTIAYSRGGPTSSDNLAPLCVGHHTVKHHGGWTLRQRGDRSGAVEWTSPAGRRYLVEPERRMPVFRPATAVQPPGAPVLAPF
ncbi:DUF222 domain-containing protein [Microbacterium sp. NPDC089189]|uniref:HNH endonuclease signature motif containing protein n=1 Tax=Microbacterium sp. NPDC089189 TaxID=3154972 RepID=UPI0034304948